MEYDPAFPTEDNDEEIDLINIPLPANTKKKRSKKPKLNKIPLPDNNVITNVLDIPTPDNDKSIKVVEPDSTPQREPDSSWINPNSGSGPLKFNFSNKQQSIKINDEEGNVFDNLDAKAPEPPVKQMPKLLLSKRSKPATLPVGVIQKSPDSIIEPKHSTELFLPPKLSDAELTMEHMLINPYVTPQKLRTAQMIAHPPAVITEAIHNDETNDKTKEETNEKDGVSVENNTENAPIEESTEDKKSITTSTNTATTESVTKLSTAAIPRQRSRSRSVSKSKWSRSRSGSRRNHSRSGSRKRHSRSRQKSRSKERRYSKSKRSKDRRSRTPRSKSRRSRDRRSRSRGGGRRFKDHKRDRDSNRGRRRSRSRDRDTKRFGTREDNRSGGRNNERRNNNNLRYKESERSDRRSKDVGRSWNQSENNYWDSQRENSKCNEVDRSENRYSDDQDNKKLDKWSQEVGEIDDKVSVDLDDDGVEYSGVEKDAVSSSDMKVEEGSVNEKQDTTVSSTTAITETSTKLDECDKNENELAQIPVPDEIIKSLYSDIPL